MKMCEEPEKPEKLEETGESEELILVRPYCEWEEAETGKRLSAVLKYALEGVHYRELRSAEEVESGLSGKRVLFAIDQGRAGVNLEGSRVLRAMRLNETLLSDCVGAIIVDGDSELYTKALGRDFVFAANRAGCAFLGRPLTEGTATLQNFLIQAKNQKTDCFGAYRQSARQLVKQLLDFELPKRKRPKLLALHASNAYTSNTTALWSMIKKDLTGVEVSEISLRNGEVMDCVGCPYTMCLHFGEKERCYYGGVIVDKVYPAVRDCDGLILLCPNYNDAVSANLCAFINRLTALFRKIQFYDKYLFGVVVSGYSGGDLVAGQLISALNMNKTFILPPRFCMLETANEPGSILMAEGIEARSAAFAGHILSTMKE